MSFGENAPVPVAVGDTIFFGSIILCDKFLESFGSYIEFLSMFE